MKFKFIIILIIGISFILSFSTVSSGILNNNIKKDNIQILNYIFTSKDNNILFVGGSGPNNYSNIQDAINDSHDGDIIFVYSRIYNESITIDKQITIIGENKNKTIINGNYCEIVIQITSNDVKITGFTIKNSNGFKENAGIKITSNNNFIEDCIIYRTKIGIYLLNAFNNEINNCTFHTNGNGIKLRLSTNNKIINCQFCHNSLGINIENSLMTYLSDSYLHTCGVGVFSDNSFVIEINDCAISDTNDNQAGMYFYYSKNVKIINCNIYHNGNGIQLMSCSDILIKRCDVYYNTVHGSIKIVDSKKSITIKDCALAHNYRYPIEIANSSIIIRNNNFYKNKYYAIYSDKSFIDARYNWWGFFTGPAFFNLGLADRITRKPFRLWYFPWKFKKIANVGSNWEIDDRFEKIILPEDTHLQIKIEGLDTDNDGCPDWWEEKWGYNPFTWHDHVNLDPDEDGLNNIEECYTNQWGSNPFQKDVFLEFDWLKPTKTGITNKPSKILIGKLKNRFKDHDIILHVDTGNLGGGEEVLNKDFLTHSDLCDYYWDYFLHNDLNNPRKGIFRYGLITNYNQDDNQVFFGWDHCDSFSICGQKKYEEFPQYDKDVIIIHASMHELGHTFGIFGDDFPGIDNYLTTNPKHRAFWQYSTYISCMNYRYVYTAVLDYSNGKYGKNDFNDWGNFDFSFFKNSNFDLTLSH